MLIIDNDFTFSFSNFSFPPCILSTTTVLHTICESKLFVDRMQGGKEKLENENVKSLSMINIDKSLFEKALNMNIINQTQAEMLNNFYENPDETMRNFLIDHPEFLSNALASDEKTASRAKLCIDSNLYNL